MAVELLVLAAIVIGNLGRTMLPYLKARAESQVVGEPTYPFDKKFLFTAAYSFVLAIVVGFGLFPVVMEQVGGELSTLSAVSIVGMAFLSGWGSTDAVNRLTSITTSMVFLNKKRAELQQQAADKKAQELESKSQ